MSWTFALLLSLGSAVEPQQALPPTPTVSLERIDRALDRGMKHLRTLQAETGEFVPEERTDVCRVALTAMALWALNEPGPVGIAQDDAERAARALLARQRAEGGIYEPSNGLPVYTSGVAARALRTLGATPHWPELESARSRVELFIYRSAAPESAVDSADVARTGSSQANEDARRILAAGAVTDPARRRALEFLARCEIDRARAPARLRKPDDPRAAHDLGPFDYEDLLPMVYLELAPQQQVVLRARKALENRYTPERNPDLTQRYGEQGFPEGTQGRFYYYLNVARTMTTFGESRLVTSDGVAHDWAQELAGQLLAAQRGDGAWVNRDARWWEGEPGITTAYAVLTLKLCRRELARRP